MYEVTRTLPFHLVSSIIRGIIRVVPLCDSIFVQGSQRGVLSTTFARYTMYVLGIDETATDTRRDINQVEFYNTSDGTPYLLIQVIARTLLSGDFQIDTRCQRHLVMTVSIVAGLVLDMLLLPVIERSLTVYFAVGITLIQIIGIVGLTHICEMHVAGQGTQVVHHIVDTKVVSVPVFLVVFRTTFSNGQVARNLRIHLVQRHLTYTVDGIVGVVCFLRHTVLSTLHHHSTTENTAQVSTLDTIHQTTGIDR